MASLSELLARGIFVAVQDVPDFSPDTDQVDGVQLLIEADNRIGIIEEVAATFDDANVNIDQLDTEVEQGMFRAHLFLVLPGDMNQADLDELINSLADDRSVNLRRLNAS